MVARSLVDMMLAILSVDTQSYSIVESNTHPSWVGNAYESQFARHSLPYGAKFGQGVEHSKGLYLGATIELNKYKIMGIIKPSGTREVAPLLTSSMPVVHYDRTKIRLLLPLR